MSCSSCGSNSGCGCANNATIVGVVLNRPSCAPCGPSDCCSNSVPANPEPYYNCAQSCPEQHGQRITIQQFAADIKVIDSWNVPACDAEATITVASLVGIVVGSYIWNPTYGFFEVTAFNVSASQITVLNHCNEGNASAGTNVPSCTEFTVTVPPCDCGNDSNVCVAIDFTAPDNGDCIDITLTSTVGLTASDTVSIGTGFYFLSAIKPNDIVTICNQGQGITPGTSVIAHPPGQPDVYNYCLGIISTNPCDRDAEAEVVLLGCGEDGVTVPLDCATVGWVPTATLGENDTVDISCRPIGTTDECSRLSAALALTSGTADYANVEVNDTASFADGDIIEFATGEWVATITNIPDGTHLDLTFDPVPGFNTSIPINTLFCLQNCCANNTDLINDLKQGTAADSSEAVTPGSIDEGEAAQGNSVEMTIPNPSSTNNMKVMIAYEYQINGDVIANAAVYLGFVLVFTPRLGFSTGAIGAAPAPVQSDYLNSVQSIGFPIDTGTYGYSWEFTKVAVYDIAPGDELKIAASNQVANNTPDANVAYSYNVLLTKVEVIYVAVGA